MSAAWTSEVAWSRGGRTAWWRDEHGVQVEVQFDSEPQSVCGLEGGDARSGTGHAPNRARFSLGR